MAAEKDVAVVPAAAVARSPAFFQHLTDVGVVQPLSVDRLKTYLSRFALSSCVCV